MQIFRKPSTDKTSEPGAKQSTGETWIWNLHSPEDDFYLSESRLADEKMREIAYSMDTLVPGIYFWLGSFALRIGGCKPDDQPYRYPGQLNSAAGVALVLPGYKIWTTYKGSYDPGQASN